MKHPKLLVAAAVIAALGAVGWYAWDTARPWVHPIKAADEARLAAYAASGKATARTDQDGRQELFGLATVVDGDTLLITEVEVDLWNIDAPELDQPCEKDGKPWACGEASRQQLAQMVEGRMIACRPEGPPSTDGRLVSMCFISDIACADSADACEGSLGSLNLAMVRQGWAFDPESEFNDDEADAEDKKLGLWAGKVERPWLWREKRSQSSSEQ